MSTDYSDAFSPTSSILSLTAIIALPLMDPCEKNVLTPSLQRLLTTNMLMFILKKQHKGVSISRGFKRFR